MASIVECSEALPRASTGKEASLLAGTDRGSSLIPGTPNSANAQHTAGVPTRHCITAILPVYNELHAVMPTVRQLTAELERACADFEIIIIDDGSTDGTAAEIARLEGQRAIRILRNDRNRGYGFSIKRAVASAAFDTILIADADGTYPLGRIGDLLAESGEADMVVGARTAAGAAIPALRRPAKWALRRLAEYLSQTTIPDLNSGFRIIKRSLIERFLPLLPDGFSFTTTITLAALTHDYRVRYVPIEYAPRIGRSSIRPIRDTATFLGLICRTMLYFKPLRIFGPLSAGLFAAAVLVAIGTKLVLGQLADVTSVTLAVAAFDVLAIGLLAELIEKRSPAFHGSAEAPQPTSRAIAASDHPIAISEPRTVPRAALAGHVPTAFSPSVVRGTPSFLSEPQAPKAYAAPWQSASGSADTPAESWTGFTFAAEPDDPVFYE